MAATMVAFKDGKLLDADLIDNVLIERMKVGQPVGNGRGVRSIDKKEPNCWEVGFTVTGSSRRLVIDSSLEIEDALRLKDRAVSAFTSGGIINFDTLAAGAGEQ